MDGKQQMNLLYRIYDELNKEFFGGTLKGAILTYKVKKNVMGYHAHERYARGSERSTEIMLNPLFFNDFEEVVSTLLHEMCHQWEYTQHTPRAGYHSKVWAAKMKECGLKPFNTKNPERETGQSCSHTIDPEGAFFVFWMRKYAARSEELWRELNIQEDKPTSNKKAKIAYECPTCGAKVWGKPGLQILCQSDEHEDDPYMMLAAEAE